jgi:Nitrile hydratase, alpha chain
MSNDLSKAVTRASNDRDYRAKLLDDPQAALDDEGIELPEGVDVKVVENDAATIYLVLPEAEDDELGLTAAELERVAAGLTEAQLTSLLMVAGARH